MLHGFWMHMMPYIIMLLKPSWYWSYVAVAFWYYIPYPITTCCTSLELSVFNTVGKSSAVYPLVKCSSRVENISLYSKVGKYVLFDGYLNFRWMIRYVPSEPILLVLNGELCKNLVHIMVTFCVEWRRLLSFIGVVVACWLVKLAFFCTTNSFALLTIQHLY